MTRLGHLVICVIAVGCGRNNSATSTPPDAATVTDAGDLGDANAGVAAACADMAKASCMLRDTCTMGGGITRTYGQLATCLQREALACTLEASAADTGKTADAVEACVTAYATLSCGDFFDNFLPAACTPAGSRPLSASCGFASQCESGYCGNNKTAVCGTCAEPPAVGASCVESGCGHGQICDVRTKTCVSDESVGDACDNNTQPCGFALACVGNSNGNPGTCAAETESLGADCNGTAAGLCDATANLSCTGTSGSRTCQVAIDTGDGQPCGGQPMGNINCGDGGVCYNAAGTVALAGEAGTCKAAAADGAACDLDAGPPCLAPARCIVSGAGTSGTCTLAMAATCDQ